jgi:SOS-response transcriptional repressor LexA
MEKLKMKSKKKEIRTLLVDRLHEAIKTLGVAKSGKKVEKILDKTSKKLATQVASQLKKESRKMRKATGKIKKSKSVNGHQQVIAA